MKLGRNFSYVEYASSKLVRGRHGLETSWVSLVSTWLGHLYTWEPPSPSGVRVSKEEEGHHGVPRTARIPGRHGCGADAGSTTAAARQQLGRSAGNPSPRGLPLLCKPSLPFSGGRHLFCLL
jgi:hypothetical protein